MQRLLLQIACAALFGATMTGSAIIIVDQTTWPDGARSIIQTNQNLPNSLGWQCSRGPNYWGTNGTMVISNLTGSLTLYGYLADSNGPPISLDVGQMVRATMGIIFTNVMDQADMILNGSTGSRGLRWGFAYAGTNQFPLTNSDISGSVSLRNMPGYCQGMNFATAFTMDGPLSTLCFTNVDLNDALFTHENHAVEITPNGGGHSNDVGFIDSVPYTFIFTVARSDTNTVDLTTVIVGTNLLNGYITQSVTDTNYAFTNFDSFGFRPSSTSVTAKWFTFTGFKVETLPITPPAPQLTHAQKQGANWVITWNCTPGYTYSVLRTNNLSTYLTNWPPALVTGYPPGYATGSSLSYTDTTATATANFYRISSP